MAANDHPKFNMKKILVIAHYFSPLNSTGARRPEALVRFLTKNDYDVTVLTTLKSKETPTCNLNEKNIRVIESSVTATRVLLGLPKSKHIESIISGNSWLIRLKHDFINPLLGQLPDPRLPFVISVLAKLILNGMSGRKKFEWINLVRNADCIISTSPPWVCHLLSVVLARWLEIPLILDYRDQFSGNHMFSQRLTWLEKRIDSYFCKSADLVVTVSEPMAEYYRSLTSKSVIVVMNGYEDHQFKKDGESIISASDTSNFTLIRYFGTITNDRLMSSLWIALAGMKNINKFRFEFYGDCNLLHLYLKEKFPSVLPIVAFSGSVPHADAINLMYKSDALLFSETSEKEHASQRGVLTTKLFEYLAIGKPIIGVVDEDTAAGVVLLRSGLGLIISTNHIDIRNVLASPSASWVERVAPNAQYIGEFSRSSQFQILENHLASI